MTICRGLFLYQVQYATQNWKGIPRTGAGTAWATAAVRMPDIDGDNNRTQIVAKQHRGADARSQRKQTRLLDPTNRPTSCFPPPFTGPLFRWNLSLYPTHLVGFLVTRAPWRPFDTCAGRVTPEGLQYSQYSYPQVWPGELPANLAVNLRSLVLSSPGFKWCSGLKTVVVEMLITPWSRLGFQDTQKIFQTSER